MSAVECGHVILVNLAHGFGHRTRFLGADEEVHVIAHEYVGVNLQRVL
jgi:hypothetical protein